jgi:hypothetical protein
MSLHDLVRLWYCITNRELPAGVFRSQILVPGRSCPTAFRTSASAWAARLPQQFQLTLQSGDLSVVRQPSPSSARGVLAARADRRPLILPVNAAKSNSPQSRHNVADRDRGLCAAEDPQ